MRKEERVGWKKRSNLRLQEERTSSSLVFPKRGWASMPCPPPHLERDQHRTVIAGAGYSRWWIASSVTWSISAK